MAYLGGLLAGAIVAVMGFVNSMLALAVGQNASSILIHTIGLLCLIPIVLITKDFRSVKGVPFWMLSGGFFGIGTTIFTNIAIPNIGVVITMCLAMLGQTVISILIDHFGIFGLQQVKMSKRRWVSLLFILCGTGIMILW